MLGVEIAVTQMESELHVCRHRRTETPKIVGEHVLHVGEGGPGRNSTVPLDHLDAHVPLDCQITMRYCPAEAFDLTQHRTLIRGEYLLRIRLEAERHHNGQGGRERYLKANSRGKVTGLAGFEKVLVRRPRFAAVSQFAEMQLFGCDTFG